MTIRVSSVSVWMQSEATDMPMLVAEVDWLVYGQRSGRRVGLVSHVQSEIGGIPGSFGMSCSSIEPPKRPCEAIARQS